MRRGHWESVCVWAVLALGGPLGGCRRPPAPASLAPDAPNILLITLDTTRADHLGCYGSVADTTPNLDALAVRGVVCDQAFTHVPITLPAHATLLTGVHPPAHGLHVNAGGVLPDELPTLATVLAGTGYETAAVIAAWVLDAEFGLGRGFGHYDDCIGGGRDASKDVRERTADEVCDLTLAWLDEHATRRFFVWAHFYDPHWPYAPPEAFAGRFDHPYDGEIAFMDAQVGRLLNWLDERGLRERTLVVVAGDHGEAFGEHGEPQHGMLIYQTTVHVPLIWSWPGHLPAGQRVGACVGLVDVMPTVLALVGLPAPQAAEGRSLMPALRGGGLAERPVYVESELPRQSFAWAALHGLVTDRWKYIDAPQPELYDRQSDPDESTNLAAAEPDVLADLARELDDRRASMTTRTAGEYALDPSAVANLAALGYVAAPPAADGEHDDADRPDPKALMPVYSAYRELKQHEGVLSGDDRVAGYTQLVAQSPASPTLRAELATAFLHAGRYDDAEREFQAVLAQTAGTPAWWCGLGESYFARRRVEEAIPCFERAVALAPNHGRAHNRLGLLYALKHDEHRAEQEFRDFLALNPTSPEALANLAACLSRRSRPTEALRLLHEALRHDPAYLPAHRNLYRVLHGLGRGADAVAALRVAHKHYPDEYEFTFNLGWLLCTAADARVRDSRAALELAQRCAAIDPRRTVQNLDLLAAALAERGDYARAASTAWQAVRLAEQRGRNELMPPITARARLYETGRPFRQ